MITSCGYPEEDFRADYVDAWCGWAADCGWYAEVDACTSDYAGWEGPADTCGEFDAKQARDCVKELDEATCPADDPAGAFPASCAAVYACAD